MKKSFTLLEVIISLSIFMILVLFLYKALDQTKHTNKQFSKTLKSLSNNNSLNKIFLEDFAESNKSLIKQDKRKNSVVLLSSLNMYHNKYYSNLTYLLNKEKKLLRIESKEIFNLEKSGESFYDNSFIDVLYENVEYFEAKISQDKKNILYVIKPLNKKKIYLSAYKLFN